MNNLITVYITNYNYGNYIQQAIESVLSQDGVKYELIIIDDGSVDNSKSIIDSYQADERISIIYQKNKGLNVSNNVALHLAQGEYIMRLDADDYLEPHALKKLSDQLRDNKDVGLVFPDYYIVDATGEIIERHQRHDFSNVTLYDQAAHGACTMIRVEYLKALGGYNESYKCQDGYELWIKFVNKYKVVNINEPLFSYRQHGENLTSNENKILGTRAQINADYIKEYHINNKSIALIPVRNKKDKFYRKEINGEKLINIKIDQALKSNSASNVIISSPDEEVREEIDKNLLNNDQVLFHKRSLSSAQLNTSLNQSLLELNNGIDEKIKSNLTSIVILDLTFPLISNIKIDDAVNTMLLFKADSLISVRPDTNKFFKHDGSGMKAIFDYQKKSKFERDVMYKHVGGITVTRFSSFIKAKEIINGKVGHIILDKNSAYKVENKQDLDIIASINQLYKII